MMKKINEDKNAQGQTGDVSLLQDSVTRSEKSLHEETTDWKKKNTGSYKMIAGIKSEDWVPYVSKLLRSKISDICTLELFWQENISV